MQHVEPMNPLVVPPPPLPSQELIQPPIPEPRPHPGQLLQPQHQGGHVLRQAPVVKAAALSPHQPARAPDTDPGGLSHVLRHRALACGLQSFFESTSCRICLSRLTSGGRGGSACGCRLRAYAICSSVNRFFIRPLLSGPFWYPESSTSRWSSFTGAGQSRSTSVTPTARGNGRPARTRTACRDSTSPRGVTSPGSRLGKSPGSRSS